MNLREPWLSAWWLIKESWNEPSADSYGMLKVQVGGDCAQGKRSEALVAAMVDLVAPRLLIEAYGKWQLQFRKFPKRPKTFHDLFQARLTSGKVVDPDSLGLQELTEGEFIVSLAYALDAAVMGGLEIARRIGWGKGDLLLHCVSYVAESKRGKEKHEPDEYNQGIAPSVKFLHAVVLRLVDIDCFAALTFINRWKQTDSPIHWRLWAAMSRDSRVASASEVGGFPSFAWTMRFSGTHIAIRKLPNCVPSASPSLTTLHEGRLLGKYARDRHAICGLIMRKATALRSFASIGSSGN